MARGDTKSLSDKLHAPLKQLAPAFFKQHANAEGRSLIIAVISSCFNVVLGLAKIILGIISLVPFACVNGIYSVVLAGARAFCLQGSIAEHRSKSVRLARWGARLLLIASILFTLYSGWSYFHAATFTLGKNAALAIATVTTFEMGFGIKNLVQARRSRSLPMKVLRAISLSTAMASLVLTQTALLSISGVHDTSTSGFLGVIVGVLAATLAIAQIKNVKEHCEEILEGENPREKN